MPGSGKAIKEDLFKTKITSSTLFFYCKVFFNKKYKVATFLLYSHNAIPLKIAHLRKGEIFTLWSKIRL